MASVSRESRGLPDRHRPPAQVVELVTEKAGWGTRSPPLRGVDMVERLADVGHHVLDILEPDRKTKQTVADPVALALVGR
jgi:hypothetical protein